MPVQTALYKVTQEAYNQLVSVRLFLYISVFLLMPIPASAAVVINELYPKTESPQTQFIELYNSGENAVSLDRWRIEQTNGEKKSFLLNASFVLQAKQFLLLTNSQTGIAFPIQGDTLNLINEKNEIIDSQGYEGILGFNTSVGRTSDGAGVWAVCTTATPEKANNCPVPTPTATPLPTLKPTPTIFVDTTFYVSTPSVTVQTVPTILISPSIMVASPSVPPIEKDTDSKPWIILLGLVIVVWGSIGATVLVRQSTKVKA